MLVPVVKCLAPLFFLLLISFGCSKENSEEVIPNEPIIEFVDIRLDTGEVNDINDSLIVEIFFQDGDQNLGLRSDDCDRPFHMIDPVFNSEGRAVRYRDVVENEPFQTYLPNLFSGELEEYLMAIDTPTLLLTTFGFKRINQYHWYNGDALILDNNRFVFINEVEGEIAINSEVFHVKGGSFHSVKDIIDCNDTIWIVRNENSNNWFLDFYYQEGNNEFLKFPSIEEYGTTFNVRFDNPLSLTGPINNDLPPPFQARMLNDKEGYLRLSVYFAGFRTVPILRNEKLKIKVRIQDRDLNRSNTVESPEFFARDFLDL